MYKFILALGIVLAMSVAVVAKFNLFNDTVTVIQESVTEEVIEEVPELDLIDSAKAELERINLELDQEEEKLLLEIKEREARLELIRETRTSFQ
jgi:RPA family protein